MSELSPTARALLSAAREGLAPDADTVRRMRGKIAASTGASVVAGSLGLKLGLLGVLALGAIGAGVAVQQRPHLVITPHLELATTPGESAVASVHVEGRAAVEVPAAAAAPARARPVLQRATSTPTADLAREVELVDRAMTALGAGDPRSALGTIHVHARETHGRGQLAEDAAAIEIEALCRLDDPAVTARLAAFDARFPRSAQRSHLTTACK